jgi:hypothetical protein
MSEETQSNNQQTVVIALVVIAVLLAAIVGVVIWQQSKAVTTLPNPTATGVTPGTPAAPGATPVTPGTPAAPGATAAAFDAKTATKVPGGTTPEQLLKAYGDNILANKYAEAYKMLPLDKQQSYGDSAAYESQVKAYGITKFNTGKPVTEGDNMTIVSEQVTPQMPITYTWAFKKVNGQWYVVSRTMGGELK